MTEPLPVYIVPDPCDPPPQTPTYDDLLHYADVGRRLTAEAGYPLDAHTPVEIVLRALMAKGALLSDARRGRW